MSKEAIEFTMKGPSLVQRYPENVPGCQKKTGCSIIDINLPQPCQLGELVFKNYYAAFISIYVKRFCSLSKPAGGPSSKLPNGKTLLAENSLGYDTRNGLGSSTSHPSKLEVPIKIREIDEEWLSSSEEPISLTGDFSRKVNSNSKGLSSSLGLAELPWECSIHMKCLMPWPHFELGSQDIVSIPATESSVEWRELVLMRLVIHQPSTVWKRFGIDDIHVFRHLPKRGISEEKYRQKDGWFMVLRENTKRMLKGQLVESNFDKEETTAN